MPGAGGRREGGFSDFCFNWNIIDLQYHASFRDATQKEIWIPFQILFPYKLLQNTECSCLCCTVGQELVLNGDTFVSQDEKSSKDKWWSSPHCTTMRMHLMPLNCIRKMVNLTICTFYHIFYVKNELGKKENKRERKRIMLHLLSVGPSGHFPCVLHMGWNSS